MNCLACTCNDPMRRGAERLEATRERRRYANVPTIETKFVGKQIASALTTAPKRESMAAETSEGLEYEIQPKSRIDRSHFVQRVNRILDEFSRREVEASRPKRARKQLELCRFERLSLMITASERRCTAK